MSIEEEFDVEPEKKKFSKKKEVPAGVDWERILKDCMTKDDTALNIATGLRAHNILTIEDALNPANQNKIFSAIMSGYRMDGFKFLQSLRRGIGGK